MSTQDQHDITQKKKKSKQCPEIAWFHNFLLAVTPYLSQCEHCIMISSSL